MVAVVVTVSIVASAFAATVAPPTLSTGRAVVRLVPQVVVVGRRSVTLYTLSGETATKLKCVSVLCLTIWPPYKVGANDKLTKTAGVPGKLGKFNRGSYYQVTLDDHPLYRFIADLGISGLAIGDGIASFGGVWEVIPARTGVG